MAILKRDEDSRIKLAKTIKVNIFHASKYLSFRNTPMNSLEKKIVRKAKRIENK